MEYNKVRGTQNNNDEESNHLSRKSSSEENNSRESKIDQWGKASDSDSIEKKKTKRSVSREAIDVKRNNDDRPYNPKNRVTNMISEKNSSKVFIPGYDGPLVSLSLFNELQHNILLMQTVENAYNEYKNKYEGKKFQSFYVEHKEDEWFKEKYDHTYRQKMQEERNWTSQKLSEKFFQDTPKNLTLTLKQADEDCRNIKILLYGYNKEKEEFEEKERDIVLTKDSMGINIELSESVYYGYDPDKLTLFLHQIPRHVSRWTILDVLKKLPGFMYMSLSEPIKNQNYVRYCWVTFDSDDNLDLAFETLNDYRINADLKLNTIKSKSSSQKKIRLTPPLYDERLDDDLEMSKDFIQFYDRQRGLDSKKLFDSHRNKENQLDLQILYLRRVFGFCYYCLEEHEDERALSTKCDHIHLRHYKTLGKRSADDSYEAEWDRSFTRLVKEKYAKMQDSLLSNEKLTEDLNRKRNQYCKENTSLVSPERFLCNLCSKMFKAPHFVHNHIFNKHMDLIKDNVDKDFYENLKYENFIHDPNKTMEKQKAISSMEDYLYYLNTIKSSTGHNPNWTRKDKPQREYSERTYNKKPRRDYKDYDNPTESSSSRKLISYDDL